MNYFGLYMDFVRIRLRTMVEYRAETIWTGVAQAAGYLAEFAVLWVMIDRFGTIGAWNPYEIMLLYALNLFAYALAGSFFYRTSNRLPGYVRTGSLDEVLTKPTNPLLYLTCSGFLYGYFSHMIVSVIVLVICFTGLGIVLTAAKLGFLILTLIGGALIYSAVFLFVAVPSFWIVKTDAIGALLWSGRSFVQYPVSIYNKAIQIVLTVILPYAFINFYPAQFLLSKNDFMMFHPVFQFLSPAVGALLFFLAYRFWISGIKHYNGSGS
ncbi:MAG: ABC-2 family transporter protein [Clostridiaceae bacterium]|nr:ABC-2 family transporter protein [Clostridiaceae bacterium]